MGCPLEFLPCQPCCIRQRTVSPIWTSLRPAQNMPTKFNFKSLPITPGLGGGMGMNSFPWGHTGTERNASLHTQSLISIQPNRHVRWMSSGVLSDCGNPSHNPPCPVCHLLRRWQLPAPQQASVCRVAVAALPCPSSPTPSSATGLWSLPRQCFHDAFSLRELCFNRAIHQRPNSMPRHGSRYRSGNLYFFYSNKTETRPE